MAINDTTSTKFKWKGTLVGEVQSITPPTISRAKIAQPKLGGTRKEHRPSSKYEVESLTLTVYCPDAFTFLADVLASNQDPHDWEIEYDDGSTDAGEGYVSAYAPGEHSEDADQVVTVTIETTSEITRTEAEEE